MTEKNLVRSFLIALTFYGLLMVLLLGYSSKNQSLPALNNNLTGNFAPDQGDGTQSDNTEDDLYLHDIFSTHPIISKVIQPKKCYAYLYHGECLSFPTEPRKPCTHEFTYHGLTGVYHCYDRSTD